MGGNVVSNEEIKRMLDAKRRGINIDNVKTSSGKNKICSKCKSKNPEKALFCVNCGNKLDQKLEIKCPSCGKENLNNAKFCVGCGERLNKEIIGDTSKKINPILESTDNTQKNDVKFTESTDHSKPADISGKSDIKKDSLKKTCPSCNGKNLINAKFCVVCGKNFNQEYKNQTKDSIGEYGETKNLKTTLPEIKVPNSLLEKKEYETKDNSEIKNDTKYFDPVEKIKKSKELLDMGAITSEEFESIKKKYLEQI
jgi:hypothetical protein